MSPASSQASWTAGVTHSSPLRAPAASPNPSCVCQAEPSPAGRASQHFTAPAALPILLGTGERAKIPCWRESKDVPHPERLAMTTCNCGIVGLSQPCTAPLQGLDPFPPSPCVQRAGLGWAMAFPSNWRDSAAPRAVCCKEPCREQSAPAEEEGAHKGAPTPHCRFVQE